MEVYSVYLGDVYLKCFKNRFDAEILSNGLQVFLTIVHMDIDMVRITKELI